MNHSGDHRCTTEWWAVKMNRASLVGSGFVVFMKFMNQPKILDGYPEVFSGDQLGGEF